MLTISLIADSGGLISVNVTFVNKIRLHEWKTSELDGQSLIQVEERPLHRLSRARSCQISVHLKHERC